MEYLKANKLAFYFKLTPGITFVVLYKYLNSAVDKTIDTGHIANSGCNTNYRTILLMMFNT